MQTRRTLEVGNGSFCNSMLPRLDCEVVIHDAN